MRNPYMGSRLCRTWVYLARGNPALPISQTGFTCEPKLHLDF
jgi:hypothetical protein